MIRIIMMSGALLLSGCVVLTQRIKPVMPEAVAPRLMRTELAGYELRDVRQALFDAIESQGLKVGTVLPFGQMLERGRQAAGVTQTVYRHAEIVQFCSAQVAWQLVLENPDFIARCPLAVAIYQPDSQPDKVVLVYRSPGEDVAGARDAGRLLQRIVQEVQRSVRR